MHGLLDQAPDFVATQAVQAADLDARARGSEAERSERGVTRGVVDAKRHEYEHARILKMGQQITQHFEASRVGPLQVLDHGDDRPPPAGALERPGGRLEERRTFSARIEIRKH